MATAHELLQTVEFHSSGLSYVAEAARFDDETGFVTLDAGEIDKSEMLLGFRADRETALEEKPLFTNRIHSITQLILMPEDEQNIDIVGKGVGMRLHSDGPQALASAKESGAERCGLYAMPLNREKIVNLREDADATITGKAKRIARHAGRIARSKLTSLEDVTDEIHASFGDPATVDVVIYNQAPRAALRQQQRGIPSQRNLEQPAFLVVRNSFLPVFELGTFALTKTELH